MSRQKVLSRVRYILSNIHIGEDLKNTAYEIRNDLIALVLTGSLAENEFYRITSLLTPQSRGPLWEKYFIAKHDCKKVHKNDGRGDIEKDGKFYEFKASGFNRDGGLNIVQIRLWHDCDYIIQSISSEGAVTFVLSHEEMMREANLLSAQVAHGTKEVTAEKKFIELRLTVKKDSDDWNRWINKYQNSHFHDS